MSNEMQVLMSSRRTVMSGEVVTFATEFEESDGVFGKNYDALGPFEISASRDGVSVHPAWLTCNEDHQAFGWALHCAREVVRVLSPHFMGGHPSQFPSAPSPCKTGGLPRVTEEAQR